MTDSSPAATRFSAGAVLSRSLGLFARHLIQFFLLAALIYIPWLLMVLSIGSDPAQPPEASLGWTQLLLFLLSLVLGSLVGAAIIHAVFQSLRSQPISLAASFGTAWRRIVPVILLALLASVGIGLASMLFLIPGLVLMTFWYVAMASCVVEGTGPVRSLGRSRELVRGHGWSVFAIIVVLVIVAMIGSVVIQLVGVALGGIVGALVTYGWQSLFSAVYAIAATVTYHDLRVAKDGLDTDRIAEMFA